MGSLMKLYEYLFISIVTSIIQAWHHFADAMTAQLLEHVQNWILTLQ